MRSDKVNAWMVVAKTISLLATCPRRSVGAVVLDGYDKIMSTGYNGVPAGMPHCQDIPCGAQHLAQGQGLDLCMSIHAEANALMQCKNVHDAETMFTTTFPCVNCFKMICNTNIKTVFYLEEYPSHRKAVEEMNAQLKVPVAFIRVSIESVFGKSNLVTADLERIAGLKQ